MKNSRDLVLARLFILQSSVITQILEFIYWAATILSFDHLTDENRELVMYTTDRYSLINSAKFGLSKEMNRKTRRCKTCDDTNNSNEREKDFCLQSRNLPKITRIEMFINLFYIPVVSLFWSFCRPDSSEGFVVICVSLWFTFGCTKIDSSVFHRPSRLHTCYNWRKTDPSRAMLRHFFLSDLKEELMFSKPRRDF